MTIKKKYKNDSELDLLVQPLGKAEESILRKSIKEDETECIVHLWQNSYLMWTARYNIIREMNLQPVFQNHNFRNKEQAALYICKKELEREDLTDTYRKFLIGRVFFYEYMLEKQMAPEKFGTKCRLATKVGTAYQLTGSSVNRYYALGNALIDIHKRVPQMAAFIMLDQCRITYESIIELSRYKTDEINAVYKAVINKDMPKITMSLIRDEVRNRYTNSLTSPAQQMQEKLSKEKPPAIRQMPVYDPDSEVNSLSMTIESWITSMQRVNSKVDLSRITKDARLTLIKELSFLENTVVNLQHSLIER